ncbi:MAG: class I SAM-dependent methyltransferase [Thaumarchaeota archaeon]|nr:class I SAM-dependent methyltransferase [Nitrososphaerota archaeon]
MSTFNDSYRGTPPWDIGRPQAEFVQAAERGEVRGEVIDVGCGTGEHSLFLAARGNPTLGVDSAPLAIEKAKSKATQRHSSAEFLVWDALSLGSLGRRFDCAIDSGLFHVFPDVQRAAYVRSLSEVLRPGGRYLMLCFSDREPADWGGPRRVSREEIRESFAKGWRVDYIKPASFESSFHDHGGKAWLSSLTRVEERP